MLMKNESIKKTASKCHSFPFCKECSLCFMKCASEIRELISSSFTNLSNSICIKHNRIYFILTILGCGGPTRPLESANGEELKVPKLIFIDIKNG